MRKPRENKHNRVYHLISRIAHRAFFLSADERDRFIDVMKRSAAFSGVRLLAWCVMTNHVQVCIASRGKVKKLCMEVKAGTSADVSIRALRGSGGLKSP